MRSPCCVSSSGDQAEAVTNRLSVVQHTSVCGQLLAVISEAMLRLWWNKVEPPKRSEGGCLLRTDHMLGGDETSAFFNTLDHVLQELSDERAHNEP